MPLTTHDLHTKPGYNIDIGDHVKFFLEEGLAAVVVEDSKSLYVQPSRDTNSKKSIVGKITDCRPDFPGDVEFRGVTPEGYAFNLYITKCRDLKKLEPEEVDRVFGKN